MSIEISHSEFILFGLFLEWVLILIYFWGNDSFVVQLHEIVLSETENHQLRFSWNLTKTKVLFFCGELRKIKVACKLANLKENFDRFVETILLIFLGYYKAEKLFITKKFQVQNDFCLHFEIQLGKK